MEVISLTTLAGVLIWNMALSIYVVLNFQDTAARFKKVETSIVNEGRNQKTDIASLRNNVDHLALILQEVKNTLKTRTLDAKTLECLQKQVTLLQSDHYSLESKILLLTKALPDKAAPTPPPNEQMSTPRADTRRRGLFRRR